MRLLVVSNRGPIREQEDGAFTRSTGGLAAALEPVLTEGGGTWLWQETEDAAARASKQGALPRYGTAFAQVPEQARAGFYEGFSNDLLWPLLHSFHPTINVSQAPWDDYVTANRAFAQEALKKLRGHDAVWVHDYHLMLVPQLIRERAEARIGWFCHVPWPNVDLLRIVPWRSELLEGLLGADVIGFHTEGFATNFLECVAKLTRARVDHRRRLISWRGRLIDVAVAPIGIDVATFDAVANRPGCREQVAELSKAVGGRRMVLGVDRLDYTKGILERMNAYKLWLERNPGIEKEVTFVQIMVPSRTGVSAYQTLKERVDEIVGQVNGRFATTGQVPIHYLYRNFDRADLVAHYRAADVALVTPLRDGMNLVAHEYVASRVDDDGVLILSEFAGAAEHLDSALIVNPYDHDDVARALSRAIRMPEAEQRDRIGRLKSRVHNLDVHRWADGFRAKLARIDSSRLPRRGRRSTSLRAVAAE